MSKQAAASLGRRVEAPFGRRACEVTRNIETGGYRIFSVRDESGPEPAAGQFYICLLYTSDAADE